MRFSLIVVLLALAGCVAEPAVRTAAAPSQCDDLGTDHERAVCHCAVKRIQAKFPEVWKAKTQSEVSAFSARPEVKSYSREANHQCSAELSEGAGG